MLEGMARPRRISLQDAGRLKAQFLTMPKRYRKRARMSRTKCEL
jgi:hypothetical protein